MTEKPKVPTEQPDPKAAASGGGAGEDRPGFDLGGAKDRSGAALSATTTPGGPKGDPSLGSGGSGSRGSGQGGTGIGGG